MNNLWIRKYKIIIQPMAGGSSWDVSNLRCTFRIEKYKLGLCNYTDLVIYNLNSTTESEILKEGARVIIEAGYEGYITTTGETGKVVSSPMQYGKIFDGLVLQIYRTQESNTDYQLNIVAEDGADFLNQGFLTKAMAQNSSPRKIINTIASSANNPIQVGKLSSELKETVLPRGKVLFGKPSDYLRKIAYENNADFYVEDGKLYMLRSYEVSASQELVLTPQTGLIGWPQQVNDGVEFKSLLNPKIRLDTGIKIDNELVRLQKSQRNALITPLDADGLYYVSRLTHYGDTRGNDWYTSVVGISTLGLGKAPLLNNSQKQTPKGAE